jgi:hypothetical protein
MAEQHDMVLEEKKPSGEENWYCPTCGRRMLITWEPKFKRTVLDAGDPNVRHSGFKGDLHFGEQNSHMMQQAISHEYKESIDLDIDKSRLAPWESWLDESGFENLWKNDDQ